VEIAGAPRTTRTLRTASARCSARRTAGRRRGWCRSPTRASSTSRTVRVRSYSS
jgi:hypothetical protein